MIHGIIKQGTKPTKQPTTALFVHCRTTDHIFIYFASVCGEGICVYVIFTFILMETILVTNSIKRVLLEKSSHQYNVEFVLLYSTMYMNKNENHSRFILYI